MKLFNSDRTQKICISRLIFYPVTYFLFAYGTYIVVSNFHIVILFFIIQHIRTAIVIMSTRDQPGNLFSEPMNKQ